MPTTRKLITEFVNDRGDDLTAEEARLVKGLLQMDEVVTALVANRKPDPTKPVNERARAIAERNRARARDRKRG